MYTEARKVCDLVRESQPGYHERTITPAGTLDDLHNMAGAGTVDNTVWYVWNKVGHVKERQTIGRLDNNTIPVSTPSKCLSSQ